MTTQVCPPECADNILTPVPEPSTGLLLLAVFGGWVVVRAIVRSLRRK